MYKTVYQSVDWDTFNNQLKSDGWNFTSREGISNRVLLTSIKDELLLDVYSLNGCNLILLKDSLFFNTGIESINELNIK